MQTRPRSKLVLRRIKVDRDTAIGWIDSYKDCVDYVQFVPGELSRLYVSFKPENIKELLKFSKDMKNMGQMVEFAPFQRIPMNARIDERENTILQDKDYIEFVEKLVNGQGMNEEEIQEQSLIAHPSPLTTPLLDALKLRKKKPSDSEKKKKRNSKKNVKVPVPQKAKKFILVDGKITKLE